MSAERAPLIAKRRSWFGRFETLMTSSFAPATRRCDKIPRINMPMRRLERTALLYADQYMSQELVDALAAIDWTVPKNSADFQDFAKELHWLQLRGCAYEVLARGKAYRIQMQDDWSYRVCFA
jgi:hypothetical protein